MSPELGTVQLDVFQLPVSGKKGHRFWSTNNFYNETIFALALLHCLWQDISSLVGGGLKGDCRRS